MTIPCRIIPNNLCGYFSLKEVEHNPLLLKGGFKGFELWLSPKRAGWKAGRSNFSWRNLTNTTSVMWSVVASTAMIHTDRMSPWYDTRIGLYFCGLSPQNTLFQSDLEKHKTKQKNKNQKTRQIPIEGHATKYLTSPPQNSQSMKNKFEKLS